MCIQRLASICEGKRIGMRGIASVWAIRWPVSRCYQKSGLDIGYRVNRNKPANRTMKNNWWRVRRVVTQFAVYMQGIA